jgi:hypothetical protein
MMLDISKVLTSADIKALSGLSRKDEDVAVRKGS